MNNKVTIKAKEFFELLKLKNQSMWDVFASLVDGEEKELVFVDENNTYLFHYNLPKTLEELQEDKKIFAKEYVDKISDLN